MLHECNHGSGISRLSHKTLGLVIYIYIALQITNKWRKLGKLMEENFLRLHFTFLVVVIFGGSSDGKV